VVIGRLRNAVLVDDAAHIWIPFLLIREYRASCIGAVFADKQNKQKAPAPSGRRGLVRSPVAT